MIRLKYQKWRVVDGDTVEVLINKLAWTLRITTDKNYNGLDTDEMKGRFKKRGEHQKAMLETFFRKMMKPRIYVLTHLTRNKWNKIEVGSRGRWLVVVRVWAWRNLGYIDYAEHMIKTGNVKKGSHWNEKKKPT